MSEKIYKNICYATACKDQVHVIEPGDTLYSIALKHHTRVRVLLELNPFIDVYNLRIGDELCVPAEKPPEDGDRHIPYVIKEGDTIGSILKEKNMRFEELARINDFLYDIPLVPGHILLFPAEKEKTEKIDKNVGKTYNDNNYLRG